MSWNIKTPGDYINGPLTVAGVTQFNSNVGIGIAAATNLHVASSSNTQFRIECTGTGAGATNRLQFKNASGAADVRTGVIEWYDVGAFKGDIRLLKAGGVQIRNSADSATFNLDDLGNLMLGTTSSGSGFTVQRSGSDSAEIKLNQTGASGRDWRIASTGSGYGSAGSLIFYDATAAAERARFNTSGAFVLGGGAVAANGVGIAFPAAQSASTDANTLDDYEEGTWTGTLKGLTSDPTTAVTATGRYTKIGRNVTVQISFEGVNTTGASGACYVIGLPFANGNMRTPGGCVSYLGLTFTGTITGLIDGSSSQIDFVDLRSNGAWVSAPHNPGTGRTISATATYSV